jgi:type I restriction-modification system DNA methylase subunit
VKYNYKNIIIPKEKRGAINEKIINIVETQRAYGITPEDIYNSFTGRGGLHGLEYKNFNSFYEYTEAKKEFEAGQFFTPPTVCEFMAACMKPTEKDLILDLTCGSGAFFNFMPNENNIYGCELDREAAKVCRFLYPAANIAHDDMRYYNPETKFDLVIGNPPFNLRLDATDGEVLSQLFYFKKAAQVLRPAGFMAIITPAGFLQDAYYWGNAIKAINKDFNYITSLKLPNDIFKAFGCANFSTKIMFFQKKSEHLTENNYIPHQIEGFELSGVVANKFYNFFIAEKKEQAEKIKAKLFLEAVRAQNYQQKNFDDDIKKYLFYIGRHPKTKEFYARSQEKVNNFLNQKKPDGMTFEEWEKEKIKPQAVINYLKKQLAKQAKKPEKDIIKLVKTPRGLKYKAYSYKTRTELKESPLSVKEQSFNEMILAGEFPFIDKAFKKLYEKKLNNYKNQGKEFKNLPESLEISNFLNAFELYHSERKERIKFNPAQKKDLNLILQKKYSVLNWQQGAGKTIAALSWSDYHFKASGVRNIFIISASLAINVNWEPELKAFGREFITIKSLKDIENIKPGMLVLVTLGYLSKYQRQIKRFIKIQSQKVGLVFDESDEITNHKTKRTRAVLNCFRRVSYKLLTTGTTTRNNINELYSQLELLYNNSINFLCDCETVYKIDSKDKDKELKAVDNEKINKPFGAYYGNGLFKQCFNPVKTSVFGVSKEGQDIYNADSLKKILAKTVITRKFKDIVGKKNYDIKVYRVNQTLSEKLVYKQIIEKLHSIYSITKASGGAFFSRPAETRKANLLEIVLQINLLIKACSVPHKFDGYNSDALPSKYNEVFTVIKDQCQNKKVAVGVTTIEALNDYFIELKEKFPSRQIFLIDGSVSFSRRKSIIKEFENTTNGILLCTQQSMASSVSVPTCDHIIIESLQWNIPRIEQFWFRFIRYNSTEFKTIHIITYNNTIEQNLLALLMAKEKLNEFIKNQDDTEATEIFNEYGLDCGLLDCLLTREKDEEGKSYIKWGQQAIS